VTDQAKNVVVRAFKGMEDALVNFVKTGKIDFKSLADSIISDMARIAIQQSIIKPLGDAFASFMGSIFANASGGVYASPGLSKYSGQIVDTPTLFPFAKGVGLMGEAGPEAAPRPPHGNAPKATTESSTW